MARPDDLIEREAELAAVAELLARARAGAGQLLVVEGPGGIGKTRVLGAARDEAREQRMRVLFARGSEHERAFPFGVVRQLFEPALFGAPPAEREEWLSGAASLTRPMWDGSVPEREEEAAYGRLHGLYWLCANLSADGPMLVCVDDAQWSDEQSVAFLGFLARRVEALPLMVAIGTRPRAEQAAAALRALVTDASARVLRPAPLSGEAVARWVRATVAGDAQDASAPPATPRPRATPSSSASSCARRPPSACPGPRRRRARCGRSGPRASRRWCWPGWRGSPAGRPRWRGPSRSSARARAPTSPRCSRGSILPPPTRPLRPCAGPTC
ncbi:MAG TPA: ATP-binding protein [Solirubrobacteraceae bacterium]|nr:ATP-binding protein [Solirubrobacteraceae bacterium]